METPPEDDFEQFGEHPPVPPEAIAGRIRDVAEPMDYASHGRIVGDFLSVEGEVYRAGLDEAEVTPRPQGGFNVYLRSHKKTIIMIGASVLAVAGAGALQFNRTHRKKKRR
ncbi:MAG TPA: hypothetical protein VG964_04020 [Candidatus Saccharimonadales bacterium]|nr:hypothetical protein [Candidatus Saccharimonadales bacterium]